MVSGLTFRSLTRFELISFCWCEEWPVQSPDSVYCEDFSSSCLLASGLFTLKW